MKYCNEIFQDAKNKMRSKDATVCKESIKLSYEALYKYFYELFEKWDIDLPKNIQGYLSIQEYLKCYNLTEYIANILDHLLEPISKALDADSMCDEEIASMVYYSIEKFMDRFKNKIEKSELRKRIKESFKKEKEKHENWKTKIKKYYEENGYSVTTDYQIGDGKTIDLIISKGDSKFPGEIINKYSDIKMNIKKCQDSGFTFVVLFDCEKNLYFECQNLEKEYSDGKVQIINPRIFEERKD